MSEENETSTKQKLKNILSGELFNVPNDVVTMWLLELVVDMDDKLNKINDSIIYPLLKNKSQEMEVMNILVSQEDTVEYIDIRPAVLNRHDQIVYNGQLYEIDDAAHYKLIDLNKVYGPDPDTFHLVLKEVKNETAE